MRKVEGVSGSPGWLTGRSCRRGSRCSGIGRTYSVNTNAATQAPYGFSIARARRAGARYDVKEVADARNRTPLRQRISAEVGAHELLPATMALILAVAATLSFAPAMRPMPVATRVHAAPVMKDEAMEVIETVAGLLPIVLPAAVLAVMVVDGGGIENGSWDGTAVRIQDTKPREYFKTSTDNVAKDLDGWLNANPGGGKEDFSCKTARLELARLESSEGLVLWPRPHCRSPFGPAAHYGERSDGSRDVDSLRCRLRPRQAASPDARAA